MKSFPIRLRLTLWYFSILAAGLLGFALFLMGELHHAMHRTVDNQLRAHMAAVQQIANEDENKSPSALRHDLDEDVELAPDLTLLEIWGRNGQVVYRSYAMDRMQVPDLMTKSSGQPTTVYLASHPLRVLVQSMPASPNYIVMVAIPVRDFVEAIHQVKSTLWIAIPLLLLLAAGGGYWIAGRALAPMRSMITATETIHPGDLSTRLEVPRAEDELHRLALTLNRMLDRLQAGFERITRFTADASHELRTPIALLRTRTELLLRRNRHPEEYRAALEASLCELEETSALLEELMLLARADAGAETLHFSNCNLTELAHTTTTMMQPLAEANNLTWSVIVPSQPVYLRGDEAALRRVLLVLIDNAVKYTPEHGRVEISLQATDRDITLTVRDTGIGIAELDLPHIFDRFYRADQSRTRGAGGAGLGLSIARWIVEKHGGTIDVESTPTVGSAFRVTLPTAG